MGSTNVMMDLPAVVMSLALSLAGSLCLPWHLLGMNDHPQISSSLMQVESAALRATEACSPLALAVQFLSPAQSRGSTRHTVLTPGGVLTEPQGRCYYVCQRSSCCCILAHHSQGWWDPRSSISL